MTVAARREGRTRLILSEEDWRALVLRHMYGPDPMSFSQEIIARAGRVADVDTLNAWLMRATAIWNATPQPDRDGKSANELLAEGPRNSRRRC